MVPVVCLLLGAPAADAATRYASPTGSGPAGLGDCPDDNPCSLEDAIEGSSSSAVVDGDEVVLMPGPYDTGNAGLTVGDAITVRPQDSQSRELITGTQASMMQVDDAATVSDVVLRSSPASSSGSTLLLLHDGAVVERVSVETTVTAGGPMSACNVIDGLLRDSTCLIKGGFSVTALASTASVFSSAGPYTPVFRNVTAWTTVVPSSGLAVGAVGDNVVINATGRNVVARGFGAGTDAIATTTPAGGIGRVATLTLTNSNFATSFAEGTGSTVSAPGSPTNQTGLPQLADPDNGDFHQLAGSPTIDAGAGDPLLGTQDLDFTARVQGAAPDIGADEFASAAPDSVAPSLTIDKRPKNKVKTKKKKAKFSITFSASEASTFTCALDNKPPVTCISPYTGKVKKGKHSVEISATDFAGNVSTVATVTWKVKRKRPKR
jgi:hypothetical protein